MPEDTEQNPVGRPTDYRPDMALQAEKLCRLGATDKELAEFFEVTERTIGNWKTEHDEFFQSLKRGKILADAEVAHSLYNRALGSNDYPPDTAACIFWLKNRQPAKWRDKTSTEISGTVGMTHEQALMALDEGIDDADGTGQADSPP